MSQINIGEYIKKIRLEKGFTSRKLAKGSGVSQPYISQLETGKNTNPSPEILKKIADALGVPYSDFMEAAGYIDKKTVLEYAILDKIESQELLQGLEMDFEILQSKKKEYLSNPEKYLKFTNAKSFDDIEKGFTEEEEHLIKYKSIETNISKELNIRIAKLMEEVHGTDYIQNLLKENITTNNSFNDSFELNDLLNSHSKIKFNGKNLTTEQKNKLLKIAETMFSE